MGYNKIITKYIFKKRLNQIDIKKVVLYFVISEVIISLLYHSFKFFYVPPIIFSLLFLLYLFPTWTTGGLPAGITKQDIMDSRAFKKQIKEDEENEKIKQRNKKINIITKYEKN